MPVIQKISRNSTSSALAIFRIVSTRDRPGFFGITRNDGGGDTDAVGYLRLRNAAFVHYPTDACRHGLGDGIVVHGDRLNFSSFGESLLLFDRLGQLMQELLLRRS